jgi:hypothetical protein
MNNIDIKNHPLYPIFLLIMQEHSRSTGLHKPWSNRKIYTPKAMRAICKAELSEVDAAIEMGCFVDTTREFIHTANTACKAALELMKRGEL